MSSRVNFTGPMVSHEMDGVLVQVRSFVVEADGSRYGNNLVGLILYGNGLIRVSSIDPPLIVDTTPEALSWPTTHNEFVKDFNGYLAGAVAVALELDKNIGYRLTGPNTVTFGRAVLPN